MSRNARISVKGGSSNKLEHHNISSKLRHKLQILGPLCYSGKKGLQLEVCVYKNQGEQGDTWCSLTWNLEMISSHYNNHSVCEISAWLTKKARTWKGILLCINLWRRNCFDLNTFRWSVWWVWFAWVEVRWKKGRPCPESYSLAFISSFHPPPLYRSAPHLLLKLLFISKPWAVIGSISFKQDS